MISGGKITFQWIQECRSKRLRDAQQTLLDSVASLGLEADLFYAGPDMVKFADVLWQGRRNSIGDAFVWCNSDVILRKNPFEIADRSNVYGFHRTEVPSGEICGGVDMYLIPNQVWDDFLSKDIPDLYCGASFVDWWITRRCQMVGRYVSLNGYIDHVTHETSNASGNSRNRYYQHNLKHYNGWARRVGVGTVDLHVTLPILGVWENSVRSALKKVIGSRGK
jgi:hypothetical protein